jgi:hypothetical protein
LKTSQHRIHQRRKIVFVDFPEKLGGHEGQDSCGSTWESISDSSDAILREDTSGNTSVAKELRGHHNVLTGFILSKVV